MSRENDFFYKKYLKYKIKYMELVMTQDKYGGADTITQQFEKIFKSKAPLEGLTKKLKGLKDTAKSILNENDILSLAINLFWERKIPKEIIDVLINSGADFSIKKGDSDTLFRAISIGLPIKIIEPLVNISSLNYPFTDMIGRQTTSLHIALNNKIYDANFIKSLITPKNLNILGEYGPMGTFAYSSGTPLHIAVLEKLPKDIIEMLISKEKVEALSRTKEQNTCNKNMISIGDYNQTPLEIAIQNKLSPDIIKLLEIPC